MKNVTIALLLLAAAAPLGGCSYGGVSASGDKVVIARNDNFLFGILRKVYVCKITDAGVTSCAESDSP